jgi:O-antigen ligase
MTQSTLGRTAAPIAIPAGASGLAIVADSRAVSDDAARQAAGHTRDLNQFLVVCWMLSVTGLSMPGRNAPLSLGTLDPVALVKLATRGISFVVLILILMRHNRGARSPILLRRLFPLALFAAWAAVSMCWSPMPAVTIGHAGDLVVLVMLSGAAGFLALEMEDYKRIFCHFTAIATVVSLLLIVLNSGVILEGGRPQDYMQPNDMAKTAGAGLILFTCCHLLWRWKWTRSLFLPAVGIMTLLVFAARSRTASILTPLVLMSMCLWFRRAQTVAVICALCGLLALAVPYSRAVEHVPDSIAAYMMRGQSADEVAGLSGRTEMWSIAWKSFQDSPIFGHGYYIMTGTGFFEVWGKLRWQTAHNAFLHVVTGLGLMGTFFLLWALASTMQPCLIALKDRSRIVEFVALVMVAWYCAMGMFELSFFGPVDTAVVLFFALLGIAAGRGAPAVRQVS